MSPTQISHFFFPSFLTNSLNNITLYSKQKFGPIVWQCCVLKNKIRRCRIPGSIGSIRKVKEPTVLPIQDFGEITPWTSAFAYLTYGLGTRWSWGTSSSEILLMLMAWTERSYILLSLRYCLYYSVQFAFPSLHGQQINWLFNKCFMHSYHVRHLP